MVETASCKAAGSAERKMNVSDVVIVLTFISVIAAVEAALIRDGGCTISINYSNGDLKEPQPLILRRGKNGTTTLIHPLDERGTLKFRTGEKVVLACPGNRNYVEGIRGLTNLKEVETKCVGGKTFNAISRVNFNFTSVACKFLPKHVARRTTSSCYGIATRVEIGFNLENEFLRTIDVCWNQRNLTTYWTKFNLTSGISGFQSSYPRPRRWESGNFFDNYNMEYQYKVKTQIKTVAKLIGSEELANRYIKPNESLFMARGHLTAKADFVYGAIQLTTFWYMNAAPQWQTFNAGNWNTLEFNVRQFAATSSSYLEVYTGIHGHASLADVNGNQQPIYLYFDGGKTEFPVPKFYWKIIHDPVARKATAFVGINDPYAKEITDDMYLCKNIANQIRWLTWQSENIVKGVSYACTVQDLRRAVPSVPWLNVTDILI